MIPDNRRTTGAGGGQVDARNSGPAFRGPIQAGAFEPPEIESLYEHRLSGTARDARLVEVFLHASSCLSAAALAAKIGVRATTIHRWRSTGGERLSAEVREGILAYLASWSLRSEYPDDHA